MIIMMMMMMMINDDNYITMSPTSSKKALTFLCTVESGMQKGSVAEKINAGEFSEGARFFLLATEFFLGEIPQGYTPTLGWLNEDPISKKNRIFLAILIPPDNIDPA